MTVVNCMLVFEGDVAVSEMAEEKFGMEQEVMRLQIKYYLYRANVLIL